VADLTPGELARIDQIHSAVMGKLAELISSAIDGIRTEGEAVVASKLAAEAEKTDRRSAAAITAGALIRCARYAMADEKRGTLTTTRHEYGSEHYNPDGTLDADFLIGGSDTDENTEAYAVDTTTQYHNDPVYGCAYSRAFRYTDRTYRTVDAVILELGTKPEATP
jgi:hypothetical protein